MQADEVMGMEPPDSGLRSHLNDTSPMIVVLVLAGVEEAVAVVADESAAVSVVVVVLAELASISCIVLVSRLFVSISKLANSRFSSR